MSRAARWPQFVAPALTVVFGIAVAAGGSSYEVGTLTEMGPGFFPTVVGCLIAALGLVMAAGTALHEVEALGAIEWRPLVATIAALSAFALSVAPLGFAPATVLLVAIAAAGARGYSIVRVALLSLGLIAGVGAIFIWGLGMNLDLVAGVV